MRLKLLLVTLVLIVSVAPSGPQPMNAAVAQEAASEFEWAPDPDFLDADHRALVVSEQTPGFGSFYRSSDGRTLFVGLTEPSSSRLNSAVSAIRSFQPGLVWERAQSVRVNYAYAQLVDWHDRMLQLFEMDGLVFTDLEFESNRLAVGVEDVEASSASVRAKLTELGVPQEAVVIVEQAPIHLQLRSTRRPLVGGTQIQFDLGGFETGTCTLGMLGTRGGVRGFVTNSHCSPVMGQADFNAYWQPSRPFLNDNVVGREGTDPAFHTGDGCPVNRTCKWADANFVIKEDGVTTTSKVARLAFGTTTWNGTNYWRVTDDINLTANSTSWVTKVGRTTGRTTGPINRACYQVTPADENYVLRCQYQVAGVSDGGDSGSPVFIISNSPALHDITAAGILWGGTEGTGSGDVFVFGNWPEIENEIGSIEICYTTGGFSC